MFSRSCLPLAGRAQRATPRVPPGAPSGPLGGPRDPWGGPSGPMGPYGTPDCMESLIVQVKGHESRPLLQRRILHPSRLAQVIKNPPQQDPKREAPGTRIHPENAMRPPSSPTPESNTVSPWRPEAKPAPKSTQERPGRPGASRAPRSSQERPGAPSKDQEHPGALSSAQERLGAPRACNRSV